ncbi:MAG: hypothetical protein WC647_04270 [Desulfomonilaceae bacterium]
MSPTSDYEFPNDIFSCQPYPPTISHATSGVKVIHGREKMDSELACIDTL